MNFVVLIYCCHAELSQESEVSIYKALKFKRYAKARCKSLKQNAKIILFSKLLNSLCFLLKIEPFAKH